MSFALLAIFIGFITVFNIIVPAFGSATVTPIIAGFVGAKDAVAVATVFYLLTTFPRIYLFRKYSDWKLIRRLLPASIIGAFLGSIFLVSIDTHIIALIILGFLIYFIYRKLVAMFGHEKQKKEKKEIKHGASFVGIITGAFQGAGVSGADLRNGYLYSKGLTLQQIHGTTAWIGMTNFALASGVRVVSGDLTFEMAWPVLATFPIIILATYLGRHLSLKIPKWAQNYIILVVMFIALVSLLSTFFRS